MKLDFGFVLKDAREGANITQELAAELLETSVSTISNYERNIYTPSDSVVVKMMHVYNNNEIGYQYLRNTKVGQLILPEIKKGRLESNVLNFQRESRDLKHVEYDLIDIAADGHISENEKHRWSNLVKEIKEVCAAAFTLTLCGQEDRTWL